MNNIFYVTLILILKANISSFSQKNFTGLFKYSQITAFEDTTRKVLASVEMVFTKEESVATQGMVQKMDKNDPSRVDSREVPYLKRYAVYVNLQTNRMMSRQRADTELVIVDDELEKIEWKILPQTKIIGNIKCQKAEAMVRGRFYTAWFAPEIPVRFGPWKLQGLPGLILQAKSADNAVEFRFESLIMPAPPSYKAAPPEPLPKMKIVDEKTFLVLKKKNEENFMKMAKSMPEMQGSSFTLTIKSIEIYPD